MTNNNKKPDAVSELRQDPVSNEWVIIATGRSKRPDDFKEEQEHESPTKPAECPFCSPDLPAETGDAFEDPIASGNVVIERFPDNKEWWTTVIENKYPAVVGDECGVKDERGPYTVQSGAGNHEVVITRDHWRSLGRMSQEEAEQVIEAYHSRFLALQEKPCAHYVLIFHNHGQRAGASVFHPHSQIIAVPVIPSDIKRSLDGAQRYCQENNNQCVHCDMVAWEQEQKKRVVHENDHMVVVAPYVPRTAFELRIYPKKHAPHFSQTNKEERSALAEALRTALGKLYSGLNNPAYNFFMHTAPLTKKDGSYDYYHWHLEILPKTATMAGFELGTGMEISTVDPDKAAAYLRSAQLPNTTA